MESFSVALVSRDPSVRALLARTFEGAPPSWSVELHEERPGAADLVIATEGDDGDVIFDPDDPVQALTEARARASARSAGTVHLVAGATSGCGVTSVALHLAVAFARRAETCLVDLDTRRRGVAERLDLLDADAKTWADAGDTEDELRLAALPIRGGFRALLAPGAPGTPPTAGDHSPEPRALVRRAAAQFARVVVDVPADADLLTGSSFSTGPSVMVAPATRGGVRRAAMFLEAHSDRRWAMVLNRLGSGGQDSAARLARRAGRTTVLELPCTPALRDAEEEGRLLEGPWTRWSRRIDRLACALERA